MSCTVVQGCSGACLTLGDGWRSTQTTPGQRWALQWVVSPSAIPVPSWIFQDRVELNGNAKCLQDNGQTAPVILKEESGSSVLLCLRPLGWGITQH